MICKRGKWRQDSVSQSPAVWVQMWSCSHNRAMISWFFFLFSVMPSAFHDGRKQYPRQLAILHRTAWICLGRILSSFPAFLKYFSRFSFTVFFSVLKGIAQRPHQKFVFSPNYALHTLNGIEYPDSRSWWLHHWPGFYLHMIKNNQGWSQWVHEGLPVYSSVS